MLGSISLTRMHAVVAGCRLHRQRVPAPLSSPQFVYTKLQKRLLSLFFETDPDVASRHSNRRSGMSGLLFRVIVLQVERRILSKLSHWTRGVVG